MTFTFLNVLFLSWILKYEFEGNWIEFPVSSWSFLFTLFNLKALSPPTISKWVSYSTASFLPTVTFQVQTVLFVVVVAKSCLTLCNPVNCSMPDFSTLHCPPEFVQTLFHWISDAIQPLHPLSPPSLPALNLCQHQGLFQWVGSSYQVAKVSEPHL